MNFVCPDCRSLRSELKSTKTIASIHLQTIHKLKGQIKEMELHEAKLLRLLKRMQPHAKGQTGRAINELLAEPSNDEFEAVEKATRVNAKETLNALMQKLEMARSTT